MCRQAIPSCTADLLVIPFDAFWQIEVNNKAHIRFVDAHAERNGGDNELRVVADEGLLVLAALRILQPRMIGPNSIALGCKVRSQLIHLLAGEAVDDARLIAVALQKLNRLCDRIDLSN